MRSEVLETAAYPEIRYESTDVAADTISPGRYRVLIAGRLSLHGVTCPHPVGGSLALFADGLVFRGECPLRLPDYRIRPVTALGGAIRLKDELHLSYHITGLPEGS